MRYELFIARRYLRTKRKTGFVSLIGWFSIIGIMIGVAALVIVLSVMNGFEREVRSRIIGFDAHIRVRTFHDQGIDDWKAVAAKIRTIPHIVGMTPYIFDKALIRSASETEGIIIKGVDPETVGQVVDIKRQMVYGALDFSKKPVVEGGRPLPGIVLGFNLADRLAVSLGDKVVLISPAGITGIFGQIPPMMQCRVAGYFETGLYEYDDTFGYISLSAAQKLFKMGKRVTGIEIRVDDLNRADEVARQIDAVLGYPYNTLTWFQLNRNLFAWMQIEKWAAFVVLSLIILVATFNIVSTLIMVVMEKTRDIGILKSMGATSRDIMRIFVFEGVVAGAVGTVLGLVIGYALCWSQLRFKWFSLPADIYIINKLPVYMRVQDFVMVAVAALFLSFAATLYPSWKASKLDPVAAIRYE